MSYPYVFKAKFGKTPRQHSVTTHELSDAELLLCPKLKVIFGKLNQIGTKGMHSLWIYGTYYYQVELARL
ncbi:TPA: hypothetical protein ACXHA5_000645 [Legionella pneumophila]|nr:hypothetical protein [Legionella pneumophila]HDQ4272532.1 hypothetical protein [Legionella pneumophila]HDU8292645.1 hypothetical protein [Legionella pneumophila]